MNRSAPITILAYGVSLAGLAAAVLLRWLLDPVLGDTLPFITLVAAIGIAVWLGGYEVFANLAGHVLAGVGIEAFPFADCGRSYQ